MRHAVSSRSFHERKSSADAKTSLLKPTDRMRLSMASRTDWSSSTIELRALRTAGFSATGARTGEGDFDIARMVLAGADRATSPFGAATILTYRYLHRERSRASPPCGRDPRRIPPSSSSPPDGDGP